MTNLFWESCEFEPRPGKKLQKVNISVFLHLEQHFMKKFFFQKAARQTVFPIWEKIWGKIGITGNFGSVWEEIGNFRRNREKTGKTGRNWEETGENGRNREETGENGKKRDLREIWEKQSVMGPHVIIYDVEGPLWKMKKKFFFSKRPYATS